MKDIYECIERSAKRGNSFVTLDHSAASIPELEILRANGFAAEYESSETDGGQYILIKWE